MQGLISQIRFELLHARTKRAESRTFVPVEVSPSHWLRGGLLSPFMSLALIFKPSRGSGEIKGQQEEGGGVNTNVFTVMSSCFPTAKVTGIISFVLNLTNEAPHHSAWPPTCQQFSWLASNQAASYTTSRPPQVSSGSEWWTWCKPPSDLSRQRQTSPSVKSSPQTKNSILLLINHVFLSSSASSFVHPASKFP